MVSAAFAERFSNLVGTTDAVQSELEAVAEAFREAAIQEVRLLASELMPAIWLRVEFEPCSFVLETEQAELEAQRSFETGLLRPLRNSLDPLAERLRPINMETLVRMGTFLDYPGSRTL